MDGAGDELFAGAGFAVDEHAAIGRGHELDLLAQGAGLDAFAGDLLFEAKLAAKLEVLRAETPGFDRILHDDQRPLQHERFFEQIEGAELSGFDRGLDGGVAGDDDDFGPGFGIHRAQLVQHFEAIAVGQPDVEQHDVVDRVARQNERVGRVAGGGDGVAFFAQNLFERIANLGFIVHDEDVIHKISG